MKSRMPERARTDPWEPQGSNPLGPPGPNCARVRALEKEGSPLPFRPMALGFQIPRPKPRIFPLAENLARRTVFTESGRGGRQTGQTSIGFSKDFSPTNSSGALLLVKRSFAALFRLLIRATKNHVWSGRGGVRAIYRA